MKYSVVNTTNTNTKTTKIERNTGREFSVLDYKSTIIAERDMYSSEFWSEQKYAKNKTNGTWIDRIAYGKLADADKKQYTIGYSDALDNWNSRQEITNKFTTIDNKTKTEYDEGKYEQKYYQISAETANIDIPIFDYKKAAVEYIELNK